MKKIIIITPTYNEEDNILLIYNEIKNVMSMFVKYNYKHIFIDNASVDGTQEMIKKIIENDKKVGLIVNSRNYGPILSPYYALITIPSDASIIISADLEDPPILIREFIEKWEQGYEVICGVYKTTEENFLIKKIKFIYYNMINLLSEKKIITNFNGYALYDKYSINQIKDQGYKYPYIRGMITELKLNYTTAVYEKKVRRNGKSKNNIWSLIDIASIGLVYHTNKINRIFTMCGFFFFIVFLLFFSITISYYSIFDINFNNLLAIIIIELLLLLGSIIIVSIGILYEYLYFILREISINTKHTTLVEINI